MGRYDDGIVQFEAKVEFRSAKAYLLCPTIGPDQVWCPVSQIKEIGDADADGNRMFTVTNWWASKQDWL